MNCAADHMSDLIDLPSLRPETIHSPVVSKRMKYLAKGNLRGVAGQLTRIAGGVFQ